MLFKLLIRSHLQRIQEKKTCEKKLQNRQFVENFEINMFLFIVLKSFSYFFMNILIFFPRRITVFYGRKMKKMIAKTFEQIVYQHSLRNHHL